MGKVQGDKTEKVVSFYRRGDYFSRRENPESQKVMKRYDANFKELNLIKSTDFLQGIRFALEFFGYEAIPMEKGKYSNVYKKAVYKLVMENNINVQDYFTDKEIRFFNHNTDKKGRLVNVEARFE